MFTLFWEQRQAKREEASRFLNRDDEAETLEKKETSVAIDVTLCMLLYKMILTTNVNIQAPQW